MSFELLIEAAFFAASLYSGYLLITQAKLEWQYWQWKKQVTAHQTKLAVEQAKVAEQSEAYSKARLTADLISNRLEGQIQQNLEYTSLLSTELAKYMASNDRKVEKLLSAKKATKRR